MPKSDLPFGSEFGPNQVELVQVLQIAKIHAGDGNAITSAVALKYGWPQATAENTRLAMRSYGLIDDQDRLTELADRLLSLASNREAMHSEFARHILFNLRGLELVRAIDDLMKAGERPTLLSISRYLRTLGVYVPDSGTHLSKMRGWLQQAGVFTDDRDFGSLNAQRVEELIGATHNDVDALTGLPLEQRIVLKALSNFPMRAIPDVEPIQANDIMRYAETLYGAAFNPKNFPRQVLVPLVQLGYITTDKAVKVTGEEAGNRIQISGKPTLVYRTEKFQNEHLSVLVDALSKTALPVRDLLRKPLSEILTELESNDTFIKGKALEALAFYFMRLLDLEFHAWRKRGKATSGAEVDVIVEGIRLVFSRWQIQCKNTPKSAVSIEDVAKEVGISLQLRSNVILSATTGQIGREALQYSEQMMRITNLNIITLGKTDLERLTKSPLEIVPILNQKARRVMEIKRLPDE